MIIKSSTIPPANGPRPFPPKVVSHRLLGDRLEEVLGGVGITKERWIAIKVKFGGPPTCGCNARQEWLNKFGEEAGKAARNAVASVIGAGRVE